MSDGPGGDFIQKTPKDSNSNVNNFMESIFETKAASPDFAINESPAPPMNLFSQACDEGDIPDSQLEALCSGTFLTQHPSGVRRAVSLISFIPGMNCKIFRFFFLSKQPVQTDVEPSQTDEIQQIRKELEKKNKADDSDHLLLSKDEAQATLMSSDSEEEGCSKRNMKKQKKTKKKVQQLGFSGKLNMYCTSHMFKRIVIGLFARLNGLM